MSDLVEIKPGDTVIVRGGYRPEIYTVETVSPATYTYIDKGWSGRARRGKRDRVIFAGPADIAARLLEQLISSRARRDEAAHALEAQRRERDKKFIAAANEAVGRRTKEAGE